MAKRALFSTCSADLPGPVPPTAPGGPPCPLANLAELAGLFPLPREARRTPGHYHRQDPPLERFRGEHLQQIVRVGGALSGGGGALEGIF